MGGLASLLFLLYPENVWGGKLIVPVPLLVRGVF